MKTEEKKSALLFINGLPPKELPDLKNYRIIACTDGALNYLKDKNFPVEILDFISGDFDSHKGKDEAIIQQKFIYTPNQDKTDFEKSLEILAEMGVEQLDIYGGSGGEMDHFMGNLTAAYLYKNVMDIKFFDDFCSYYFISKKIFINAVKGKTISLYPFPKAKNITTKGLKWSLNHETLNQISRIGTRNIAIDDEVAITYSEGDLLIFVEL